MPEHSPLIPHDEHNRRLEANVRPHDWSNPVPHRPYHLVVIGAGTAGLVTAAGAAGLGARVALVERERMGGDCLNVGCVPSKAVLHAARSAAALRHTSQFGVEVGESRVDFVAAMERMRRLRADISPHDSAERFTSLGVDVYFGQAAFSDLNSISVSQDDGSVRFLPFKRAVIATGAQPAIPDIPGLSSVPFLTNETLFSLTELPPRMGVIGSGPIGCEMAQAFARLGSKVSLFERQPQILSREDRDAAKIIQRQFERDGIQLLLECREMEVSRRENGICVAASQNGSKQEISVDQLLVATGRIPNTGGLQLETVQVQTDQHGIKVNDYLQSSNARIYAAGDVCSKYKFTHAADFMARIVIQNALFALGPFGRKKVSDLTIPWATYTSPELAHVGLNEQTANANNLAIDTYVQQLSEVDRAKLDGHDQGFVKIHTQRGTDKIVGATIVAEHAGDLISEITLAMQNQIGLGKIAATIHPYPTQAEAIRKLGDSYNRTKLTPWNQRLLNALRWLNVGN